MTLTLTQLKSILFRALAEPVGLVLRTSDPVRARQRLYAAARTDPVLTVLQIRAAPQALAEVEGANLVIVRGASPE